MRVPHARDSLNLSNEDNNTDESLFREPREESIDEEVKPIVSNVPQMVSESDSSDSEEQVNEFKKDAK